MSNNKRVAVVGGGIVGLAAALELCEMADVEVHLYDPSLGGGATFAAAGMLAPAAEARPGESESYELQAQSIPSWRKVFSKIGLSEADLHSSGTLYVGFDASDRRQLEQLRSVILSHGAEVRVTARGEEEAIFQGVHPNIQTGLFLPNDAWIEPDLVVEALKSTLENRGIIFHEQEVVTCTSSGSLTTKQEQADYSAVVLTTGSAPLSIGFPLSKNSVRPVRGITVHLYADGAPSGPMIRAFVRGRDFYAVNRGAGNFVIGASSEERSEMGVELGELERLFRDAAEVLPFLEGSVVVDIRRGLRPASSTSDPFLERIADSSVVYSSGHFRHGVTLAPVTALETVRLVKEIIDEN